MGNVTEYNGSEKYIFVSYCHKDKDRVQPIISALASQGYRVWFDSGIYPGTEWPEVIAAHLEKCSAFIACVSGNSIQSHNCRNEINYAILKGKPFIGVILERVQLTPGMEMQMSTFQSLYYYNFRTFGEFFDRLTEAPSLEQCRGEIPETVSMKRTKEAPAAFRRAAVANGQAAAAAPRQVAPAAPKQAAPEVPKQAATAVPGQVAPAVPGQAAPAVPKQVVPAAPGQAATAVPKQVVPTAPKQATPAAPAQTAPANPVRKVLVCAITRVKTGEVIPVNRAEFSIGRKKDLCSYAVTDNPAISRVHAFLRTDGRGLALCDNGSLNLTYLNGTALPKGGNAVLKNGDEFSVADEKFRVSMEFREIPQK